MSSESFRQWDLVSSELRAYRDSQKQAWGDIDNVLLGRYLAGDVTPEEHQQIETALQKHPDLRQLTDLVRDVLADCPVEEPVPATIPIETARRKKFAVPFTRRTAWLVAACLLVAVGVPALGLVAIQNSQPGERAIDGPVAFFTAKKNDVLPATPGAARDAEEAARRRQAESLVAQGKEEMAKARYADADLAFDQALSLKHDLEEAKVLRGMARQKLEELRDAQNKRNVYNAAMTNGFEALEHRHYEMAVQQFNLALLQQPNDATARTEAEKARRLAEVQAVLKTGDAALRDKNVTEAVKTVSPVAVGLMERLRKLVDHASAKSPPKKD